MLALVSEDVDWPDGSARMHGKAERRLSLTRNSAWRGLVSISTDGKFKGVPLEVLLPATVKHILLGLRPR